MVVAAVVVVDQVDLDSGQGMAVAQAVVAAAIEE